MTTHSIPSTDNPLQSEAANDLHHAGKDGEVIVIEDTDEIIVERDSTAVAVPRTVTAQEKKLEKEENESIVKEPSAPKEDDNAANAKDDAKEAAAATPPPKEPVTVTETTVVTETKKDKEEEPDTLAKELASEAEAIEKPRVQVYGSTVSGNRVYKKQAKELFMWLEAEEVDFEFICIAADQEAKKYMRRKALGNMTIPQVYVDGEFKGLYDDAFKANEIGELYEWLGLYEEPFEY